jgi:C4-dicarboxylate-specific signal transduction histidine kinase
MRQNHFGSPVFRIGGASVALALFACLWALAAWFGSGVFLQQRVAQLVERQRQEATISAEAIGHDLEQKLNIIRSIPIVLAEDPSLVGALRRFGPDAKHSTLPIAEQAAAWRADPEFAMLAQRLSNIVSEIGANTLLAMNAAGDCIAAGYSPGNNDFTAANYGDRAYFHAARNGKVGQQFAVGRVTNYPAIFYSFGVRDGGKFIGAIGIRMNLATLSQMVSSRDAFVTDENGVIILSPDTELQMRALPGTEIRNLSVDERVSRYKQDIFEEVELFPTNLDERTKVVRWNGKPWPYVLVKKTIQDHVVTVYVLRDLKEIGTLQGDRYWWFILASVSGGLAATLVAVGVTYWLSNRQHSRDLRQLNESLTRRNEEQSQFISMLSHELRMPLSVIRMALRKDGPLGQANQRRCIQAVGDINDVVECCLYADRLEHGRIEVAPEPVDLAAILKSAAESQPEGNRIDIRTVDLPMLQTDRRIISVIVNNLIGNAVKYGLPGAPVEVRVCRDGAVASVTVSNAIGSAGAPDPEKVFAKYYRSPQASGKTGSGLGLFIAASFARMIGGDLRYLPDEANVRFELRVPV